MSEEKTSTDVIVKIDKEGGFTFSNQMELAKAAQLMITTKHAPDHLIRDGHKAVAAAMIFCKQYGLSQSSMNYLAWIKGKLAPYGKLYTAIAEKHPQYGGKREYFVDIDCEEICVKNKNLSAIPYAAVIDIKKKGDDHWTQYFFSMDDASAAGLTNPKKRGGEKNLDSPWIKYVKDMLKHRARQRAYDAEYASALQGCEYYETMIDVDQSREVRDITPVQTIDTVKDDLDQIEFDADKLEVIRNV